MIASTALRAHRNRHLGTLMHCCEAGELVGRCFDQCSFECIDFHRLSQVVVSLTRKRIAEREAEIHDLPWMDRTKTTPWELSETDKVKKLRRIIREEEPVLIIGSPCCTAFCKPHRLSEGKGVYEYQVRMTRYLLREHPLTASSWAL